MVFHTLHHSTQRSKVGVKLENSEGAPLLSLWVLVFIASGHVGVRDHKVINSTFVDCSDIGYLQQGFAEQHCGDSEASDRSGCIKDEGCLTLKTRCEVPSLMISILTLLTKQPGDPTSVDELLVWSSRVVGGVQSSLSLLYQ
eukprot:2097130-Amphidinium_carterae.1